MYIASKLRKENVCEYLLYMWQIEDLIRAFDFNIDMINEHIVQKYEITKKSDTKLVYEWYDSLIEMMRLEGIRKSGHLQINKNIIIDLNDFHELILKSGQVPAYNAKFFHIIPFLNQLRSKSEDGLSNIELCFNFMYGIMVLRMKKAEIKSETLQTVTEITKFMVLLARNHKAYGNGELDLEA